jgi:glycosyltransferase involved in cell wall biosynthesis
VGTEPRLPERESHDLAVHWLPRQDRDTLLKTIIPTFSVFVYPSRFDGLPLTLLEVMAAGVPVVVSDYKALPEVVDHGHAGKIAPASDVERLVAEISSLFDTDARNQFGNAARDRVRARYTTEVTMPALGQVYRSALRSKKPSTSTDVHRSCR